MRMRAPPSSRRYGSDSRGSTQFRWRESPRYRLRDDQSDARRPAGGRPRPVAVKPAPAGRAARLAWQLAGLFFVALGLIGIPLPLLPTTPFLLLALYCFARSSPRLHDWLLHHPKLGPALRAWQRHRAIPRRAKILAGAMMAASLVLSLLLAVPAYAIGLQALALAGAAAFVFTRPSPPPDAG